MEINHSIPTNMPDDVILKMFYGCLESSDDGFLIVDTEGKIAYINKAYCDYISKDQRTAVGRPVEELIDTSRMTEVAQNPDYVPEIGVLHKVSAYQYRDGEHYSIVNRANISENGVPIGGVGQIKFVKNTLKLSKAINNVYDELAFYKEELQRLSVDRYSFRQILGESVEMQAIKNLALRIMNNDFPILITGEVGTGKVFFANAIHYAGKRKNRPFVRINCAEISMDKLEDELFGYEGRSGDKKGKFELADGGTLFLDEIGDMPAVMQAKILHVLQRKEIERGGGSIVPVDVRIIAATSKDLEQEIAEKRFRADLYFRLNVLPIKLPPLRERPGDIDVCIDAFLAELNEKYHSNVRITPEARKQLRQYSWPGNVRELKNIIERCFIIQDGGVISSMNIPEHVLRRDRLPAGATWGRSLESIMDSFEREVLLDAIRGHQGNLRATANDLGIHRVTLYKKMEKFGITRDDVET